LTKPNMRKKAYGLIVETKGRKSMMPGKENKLIEQKCLDGDSEFARLRRQKVY